MAKDQAAEREQRELKDAARFLREELLDYSHDETFAAAYTEALPLFWNKLYDKTNMEEIAQDETRIFCDWFAFDYPLENGRRVIEAYQEEKGAELTSVQQQTLEKWLTIAPLSGYELLSYEGQSLQVREIMTGETYQVFEPAGHGNMDAGDVILAHLAPVLDHLEFTTDVPYIPEAEVKDLAEKLAAAQENFLEANPGASHEAFLRQNNYLLAKHALEQAEEVGRPPVARLDPNRPDKMPPQPVRRFVRR